MARSLRRGLIACLAALAACCLWAASAPPRVATHDQLFEIPGGTWARRMAGEKIEILPARIDLTIGLNDELVMKNADAVPHIFGAVLIMPGQEFRLPFRKASEYQFACTAHASGQMTIGVAPYPDPGWERLAWHWRALGAALKQWGSG